MAADGKLWPRDVVIGWLGLTAFAVLVTVFLGSDDNNAGFLGVTWLAWWVTGIALWIWAIVDVVRVPPTVAFAGGTRTMWVVLVILFGALGASLYSYFGRPDVG